MLAHEARCVERRHQAAEPSNAGQRSETSWISQPPEDLCSEDPPHLGHRDEDAGGIGLGEEHPDPLVQFLDLLAQVKRDAALDGDVLGELAVLWQKGLFHGVKEGLGMHPAPPPAPGVAVQEPGQPGSVQLLHGLWAGVARRQNPERGLVGQVGSEHIEPLRPQDLKCGLGH